MTPPDVVGPIALLDLAGTALAVAGSIAGAIALFKFFTTVGRVRRYKAHARDEQSQNTKSLRGTLLGCRKAIDTARDLESREAYFRSIIVLSITLQGALTRYEAHIAHDARHAARLLSLLLLDATTVGHKESSDMLRAAHRHIGIMLQNIRPPPADPRPDA